MNIAANAEDHAIQPNFHLGMFHVSQTLQLNNLIGLMKLYDAAEMNAEYIFKLH